MTAQLHQAYGIVRGRVHSVEDPALLRAVELDRKQRRSARRARRHR